MKGFVFSTICLVLLADLCFARDMMRNATRTNNDWPCPIAADISPCVCTADENQNLDMDCSSVTSDEQLATAFTAVFPFIVFRNLLIDCNNCYITTLSMNIFGPVQFTHISIAGSNLQTVEQEAFGASHSTLKQLDLPSNQINSFTFEAVGEFSGLTKLNLHDNKFDETVIIPDLISSTLKTLDISMNPKLVIQSANFVQQCPVLEILRLGNIGMTHIPIANESPIGMFTGLEKIYEFNFNSNGITVIQTNTFIAEQKTFTKVNLSHNDISILHPNFITGFKGGLTSSQGLLLNDNKITLLDEAVFKSLLEELAGPGLINLENNPLRCGCEMEWLAISDFLMSVITEGTTCADGTTNIHSLDAAYFEKLCH